MSAGQANSDWKISMPFHAGATKASRAARPGEERKGSRRALTVTRARRVTSAVCWWVPGATPARPLSGLRQTWAGQAPPGDQPGGGGGRSGQVQAVKTPCGSPRRQGATDQRKHARRAPKESEKQRRAETGREGQSGESLRGQGEGEAWVLGEGGAQGLLWLLWFPGPGHSDAYRPRP